MLIPCRPGFERRLNHHANRCDKLFMPLRSDAVYCSGECRTQIYRMRLADDAVADSRPVYLILLRAEPGVDGSRALKALLRFALQKFGLRTLRQEQSKDAA
jgi:hypothetical protein